MFTYGVTTEFVSEGLGSSNTRKMSNDTKEDIKNKVNYRGSK